MKEREPLICTRRRRPRRPVNHRSVPESVALGTTVLYRQHPLAAPVRTRIRSVPWRLPHGALVVLVEGRGKAVALWSLELADEQLRLFQ